MEDFLLQYSRCLPLVDSQQAGFLPSFFYDDGGQYDKRAINLVEGPLFLNKCLLATNGTKISHKYNEQCNGRYNRY
jgi:hypothetical protein